MEWAAHKLVATMADSSRRIVFFTDPTARVVSFRCLASTLISASFTLILESEAGVTRSTQPTQAMRLTRVTHPIRQRWFRCK